jgi:pyrimidine operon attenuation protein/uracil phosphoribosyltransferase
VVSHACINRKLGRVARALAPKAGSLFHNTLVGVEADGKVLAVLIRGMVGKHLAAGGALESLEAGFALDGLGSGVLASR